MGKIRHVKGFIREHSLHPHVQFDSDPNITKALLHIFLYVGFVILTTSVALSSRHLYMFYFNHAIIKHFAIGENYWTVNEWWAQLVSSYIPDFLEEVNNTRNGTTSNEQIRAAKHRGIHGDTELDRGLLNENLIMGPPRLRQVRVKRQDCVRTEIFSKYFKDCYPAYSWWHEDKTPTFMDTNFRFQRDLSATNIYGIMHTYVGGGYVVDLPREMEDAKRKAVQLFNRGWIDSSTRLLLLEYTIHNENTGLFNNVKFLGEILPTGGVLVSVQVFSLKAVGLWMELGWHSIGGLLFYLMALYYFVKETLVVLSIGVKYYMFHIRSFLNVAILLLTVLSFIYNIWHPLYLINKLREAYERPNDYHSLDVISFITSLYLNSVAILTFLVWIKLFSLICFNKLAVQLNNTFLKCYKELLGFLLIFIILFLSYALLGFLLFGTEHSDFFHFVLALWAVMRMVLCDFDYNGVKAANRVLGPIYFLSFVILVYFILINMFLAIIFETFNSVKDIAVNPSEHIKNFVQSRWQKFSGAVKVLLNHCWKRDIWERSTSETKLREVNSADDEPAAPRRIPGSKRVRVNRRQLMRKYFKTVRSKEDAEQLNKLTEHISALEEVLNKLRRDIKLLEVDIPEENYTLRMRPPPPPPPRRKIFVPRYQPKDVP